jgi:hypothetical protein
MLAKKHELGYLTCIITTRRMTSCELLKYWNGFLMAQARYDQGYREHLV